MGKEGGDEESSADVDDADDAMIGNPKSCNSIYLINVPSSRLTTYTIGSRYAPSIGVPLDVTF